MSGFVTDKESRPLEGATVTIVGNKAKADTTTDSEGAFVLNFSQAVAVGEAVRIHIEKIGFKPYEKWSSVSPTIPLRVSLDSIRRRSLAPLVPLVPPERTTEYPPPPNDPWVQTFNGGGCENGVPDITHDLTIEQAIRLSKQSRAHSRMWGLQDVTAKCLSNQVGSFATLDFPVGIRSSASVISYPPSTGATAIKFWIRWNASKADGSVKWVISEGCVSSNLDVSVPELASIVDPVGESPGSHTLAKLAPLKCKPDDMVVIKIGRNGDQDTGHTIAHLIGFTVEYKRDLGPAPGTAVESAKPQSPSPPVATPPGIIPEDPVKAVEVVNQMRNSLVQVLDKKETVTFLVSWPDDDTTFLVFVSNLLSSACHTQPRQCWFTQQANERDLDRPPVKGSGRRGITVHGPDGYALATALGAWFTTYSTATFPPEMNGYNQWSTKEIMWIEIGPGSPWKPSTK